MRMLATTALTLVAIGGTAVAADLSRPVYKPVPPLPPVMQNWSGFYVGLNAGGGIGTGSSDFSIAGVPAFASVDNQLQGAIGGGQAGFNWQAGAAVLGVEADFQASGLKGSLTTPCLPGLCGAPLTATYSQKVPWFGTARARIGYAANGWLLYATGGYAYARLETDASAVAGPATATFTLRETRNGWTAGTGIEVEFAPRWSARLEYLYFDFGNTSSSLVLTGLPTITDDAHLTMNVVRGGVNFRF
jgi:opacity protein-like surface antigen